MMMKNVQANDLVSEERVPDPICLQEYGLFFGPASPDSLRAVEPGLLPLCAVSLWRCSPQFPKRYRRERSTGKQACREKPTTGNYGHLIRLKV